MSPVHDAPDCSLPRIAPGQTLLIDADDTLWENNIFFEQAIADFIAHLNHEHLTPAEVRDVLNGIERESILEHGYGVHSFRRSLLRCFEQLREAALTAEQQEAILRFTDVIENHAIHLLPGVLDALPILARHHRLLVMTKGDFSEQSAKVARAGIEHHFAAIEIHGEKTSAAYRAVIEKYRLDVKHTWMIGNSPKSDINPAMEAGMHTILVAHPNTWVLEHEELCSPAAGQHCLQVLDFGDLLHIFM